MAQHPKYKSRRRSEPKFYVDPSKIKFTRTQVKLESVVQSRKKNRQRLNWFRLAEHDRGPMNAQYSNPRVSFDGINWFLTVGIECSEPPVAATNDGVGIDLGVKDLAICSSGHVYKNINKTSRVRRLKKKQRRLQRKISRKYEKNKKGASEDLNVKGMMKNKHLAKAVQEQKLAEFYRIMQYKYDWNGIRFITADRFYASSKLCSVCGHKKNDLKLSDRIYRCENCGTVIDRDFNASVNLLNYGKSIVNH